MSCIGDLDEIINTIFDLCLAKKKSSDEHKVVSRKKKYTVHVIYTKNIDLSKIVPLITYSENRIIVYEQSMVFVAKTRNMIIVSFVKFLSASLKNVLETRILYSVWSMLPT